MPILDFKNSRSTFSLWAFQSRAERVDGFSSGMFFLGCQKMPRWDHQCIDQKAWHGHTAGAFWIFGSWIFQVKIGDIGDTVDVSEILLPS